MESRDRIGKILLVTLVLILAFVAYKRTNSAPAAVTSVETKSDGTSLLVKEDVEKIVKDFILNNPDILIESIEKMHKRKMDEMNAKTNEILKQKKSDLENDKLSPVVGSGNINVIMMFDYACGYCKKANDIINKLLEIDKDVKVIYKPYPILGDSSEYITKVVLAVYKLFPDKFLSVHNALMTQKIASRDDVVRILEQNNLPVANVEAEFDNPDIKDSQHKLAIIMNDLKIQGVPAFIINDILFPGLLDLDKLQAIVAEGKKSQPQKPAENLEQPKEGKAHSDGPVVDASALPSPGAVTVPSKEAASQSEAKK
jgi:protein-disulfide isomerase